MNLMQKKLIVAAIAVIAAVTFLAISSSKGWVYYTKVDAFLADADKLDQRVRINGLVGAEDFSFNSALCTATFKLMGETGSIPVVYNGPIPDMFQPDRDVVVEGKLDENGVFQADVLQTKCASKYDPEEEAKRIKQAGADDDYYTSEQVDGVENPAAVETEGNSTSDTDTGVTEDDK